MAKTIYERMFGLKPCIIASYPYATRNGGARLHPEVVESIGGGSSVQYRPTTVTGTGWPEDR